MEGFRKNWFEMRFTVEYVLRKGDEFQEFFATIMEKRFPDGDFIKVRPWGRTGDRKNDGYVKSARHLFQCYAPNDMEAAVAVAKIEEDFAGASEHWREWFDVWIFVHNSKAGLSPQITKKLLELSAKKPPDAKPWGFEDLKARTFELSDTDIESLLGPGPSLTDVSNVSFQSLERVLKVIARTPTVSPEQIRPVPADKILSNGLSDNVQELLRVGTTRSRRVEEYFSRQADPNLGDEIVQSFHDKYMELDRTLADPDEIFAELHKYAGGVTRGAPEHEAAVLAVLAYLFESCEIYKAASIE